jgi:hypothetical protein
VLFCTNASSVMTRVAFHLISRSVSMVPASAVFISCHDSLVAVLFHFVVQTGDHLEVGTPDDSDLQAARGLPFDNSRSRSLPCDHQRFGSSPPHRPARTQPEAPLWPRARARSHLGTTLTAAIARGDEVAPFPQFPLMSACLRDPRLSA